MKKELMAGVLTLTAGMATTISFPQYALAKSTIVEQAFAKKFRLKSESRVRFTDAAGQTVVGRLYMDLEQTPFSPERNNRLKGEMTGMFYFESDDVTSSWEGREFKTITPLTGDDGEVLLDLVDKNQSAGRTYQIYGCNSTRTACSADTFTLRIDTKNQVDLDVRFGQDSHLEIEQIFQGTSNWYTYSSFVRMEQVPVE